jgi:tetratricopeptide (TPR) repeat protein
LGLIVLGLLPGQAWSRAAFALDGNLDTRPSAGPPPAKRITPAQEPAGQARWDRGERREAVAELEDWLSAHPDAHADWLRLAGWRSRIRRHTAALAALERLPAELARGTRARHLRGEALFALDRLEEALEYLDPERRDHARFRIESLESLGRRDDLERELAAAEARFGAEHPDFLVARGQLALRAGDAARARDAFERALALDDLELRALYGLGTALIRSGERERGLELLQKHRTLLPLLDRVHFAQESLALAPNHAPNHAALAEAWRDLGRLDAAELSFRQALELVTVAEAVPVGLRWARFLEEQRERPRDAVAHLDRLFETLPTDPRLPVRAGDILARLGDKPEAAKRFRAALELRPGDAQIQARLAKVL